MRYKDCRPAKIETETATTINSVFVWLAKKGEKTRVRITKRAITS